MDLLLIKAPFRKSSMANAIREFFFPTFATQKERRLNLALQAAYLATAASVVWIVLAYAYPVVPIIALAGSVAFVIGLRKALESAHHRALARLRDAQFLICPQCQYNLRASINTGQCPECGTKFDLARLRRDWTTRYVRLLNRVVTGDIEDGDGLDDTDWW